jgi:hypothetical protein
MFPKLNESIEFLQGLELKDFPLKSVKRKKLGELANVIKDINQDEFEYSDHLYIRQVIWLFNNIEIDINKLNVQRVSFGSMFHQFAVIPKMLLVMGFSIMMLIPIGTVDLKGVIPNLMMPIVISFAFLIIWILSEFYFSLKYLFKNFMESWGWS